MIMALPVMQTPLYEMTIPSTKRVVKFRPFLVKEEKALLIAQQSEDASVMLNTLKQVIVACVQDIDVEKLAMFDFEYIFTQLRARSVGEYSELTYNCLECKDPKAKMNVDVDLTKLEVKFDEAHTDTIDLFDEVGVKMKYPGLTMMSKLEKLSDSDVESAFDIIANCIEFIYDGDKVYPIAEQSRQEVDDFLGKLTRHQLNKIQEFFKTMPKLEHSLEFDCPVCKFHHKHTVRGMQNFF